jgi:multidrug efflux pump subunit AcrA (membrane-fusion protein)
VASAEWQLAKSADGMTRVEAPARVLGGPGTTTVVSLPLRATVLRLHTQVGDTVDAGTALVEVLMPEALEAAGRSQGARVRLDAWSERYQQLLAMRADGLVKSLDVSEAAARVAELKAELQGARAILLAAGLRESETSALLAGNGVMFLRAPVSGVVTQILGVVGESREPGAGPLIQLASVGPVRVEARFAQWRDGGDYTFVPNSGGPGVPLRLVTMAPTAEARDGSRLAWFEPEKPQALLAGSLGRVRLTGVPEPNPTVRVPSGAIRRAAERAQIVTKKGAIEVTVIRCEVTDCLVQGEVKAGDEVRVEAEP